MALYEMAYNWEDAAAKSDDDDHSEWRALFTQCFKGQKDLSLSK